MGGRRVKYQDGQMIGACVFISEEPTVQKYNQYFRMGKFKCRCSEIFIAPINAVKSGNTSSCGCLFKELISKRTKTHGKTNTGEYRVWTAIRSRCYNKNSLSYKNYGGRGIIVCERWKNSFKWATPSEQANNTRRNVKVYDNGIGYSVSFISEHYGIPKGIVYRRIRRGWPFKEIVNKPLRKNIIGDGETCHPCLYSGKIHPKNLFVN